MEVRKNIIAVDRRNRFFFRVCWFDCCCFACCFFFPPSLPLAPSTSPTDVNESLTASIFLSPPPPRRGGIKTGEWWWTNGQREDRGKGKWTVQTDHTLQLQRFFVFCSGAEGEKSLTPLPLARINFDPSSQAASLPGQIRILPSIGIEPAGLARLAARCANRDTGHHHRQCGSSRKCKKWIPPKYASWLGFTWLIDWLIDWIFSSLIHWLVDWLKVLPRNSIQLLPETRFSKPPVNSVDVVVFLLVYIILLTKTITIHCKTPVGSASACAVG